MTHSAGTRFGPYEILTPIGAGGMGEVYRARDTRLDRTVAIKILSGQLASADRRSRFQGEARIVSTLSHPHICALYDVGQQDGIDYAVMEYLEGDTLAQRLARGPLPLDQLLAIGRDIADALSQAHRAGVTHRDLKPSNVMLTSSGAKLLDFGLAKSGTSFDGAGPAATVTPTLTAAGTILGTFPYMSPEQIQGDAIDTRSDIFSFGAMLYEMAAGRRAFTGSSAVSVLSAIEEKEPEPVGAVRPGMPPLLERLIATCLAKDPARRWQNAYDIKLQLENIRDVAGRSHAPRRSRRHLAGWLAAALMLVAAAGGWLWRAPAAEPAHSHRSSLLPPEGLSFEPHYHAVSPDGNRLAFVSLDPRDGRSAVWVRSLEGRFAQQQIGGTDGAIYPFWAPDSVRIAFFADGQLKVADTRTGAVRGVASAPVGRGGTWNADGTIVFAPAFKGPLVRVSEGGGGRPEPVTAVASGKSQRWPVFLPDGTQFLFFEDWGVPTDSRPIGLYGASLAGGEAKLVSADITGKVAFAAGHLLYLQDASLMARAFDVARLVFTGPPVPLLDQEIRGERGFGHSNFSVSDTGVIVFQSLTDSTTELIRYSADGTESERLPVSSLSNPSASLDGRLIAYASDEADGNRHIVVYDLQRGITTRVTTGGREASPVWSPDGKIGYHAERQGVNYLYEIASTGGTPVELIRGRRAMPSGYSADGRGLAYTTFDADLPSVSVYDRALRTSEVLVEGAEVQFSPNGPWLSMARLGDVWLVSTDDGHRVKISGNGGGQARWSQDGRKIYYFAQNRRLMEVSLEFKGDVVSATAPRELFQTNVVAPSYSLFHYDLLADGGFVINSLKPGAPLTMVSGWTRLLGK